MSRRGLITAVIFGIFLSVVTFRPLAAELAAHTAEPDLATYGLVEDIRVLGEMLNIDLSQKPFPRIILLPPDKFDEAADKEIAASGLIPAKYAAYFQCAKNELVMMYPYVDKTAVKHFGPKEHFLKIRFHELYHWAMCQTEGIHHFQVNKDPNSAVSLALLQHEESRAQMLERRYLIERLGALAPDGLDFLTPYQSHWSLFEELLSNDPSLNTLLLRWQPTSGAPVAAATHDGTPIFVYVFRSTAKQNTDEFFFDLVSHRGKYVEVTVFKNRVYYRGWSDEGYVRGNPGNSKFPANPVYRGQWVRTK